ncbi:MAG: class I SAM-dependent methyltransferase [Longimonas sp.]|uniref:SAM-dependent methyltransferase n=1 Tax=Longimonas sp. TaxID=2039626 RepID=UPI003974FDF1
MSNFPRTAHTFNYPRYLKALQSVSARAQSDVLYQRFIEALVARADETKAPLRLLEIGAGRGDQMQRILDDMATHDTAVHYTALEPQSENRAVTESVAEAYATPPHTVTVQPTSLLDVTTGDEISYDAIVARSVLDLMPLHEALTTIEALIPENGLLYAPLTFAMGTKLAPYPSARTASTEHKIASIYHNSVYQKTELEDGAYPPQEIVHWANKRNARVAMRGSDWVIAPSKKTYVQDEAYALQSILAFMHDEAEQLDTIPHPDLDSWWATRMRMLHNNTLIYTANQFDLLIQFD